MLEENQPESDDTSSSEVPALISTNDIYGTCLMAKTKVLKYMTMLLIKLQV